MLKLNNKGFAISTILYGLLVVTMLLSVTVMSTMSFNRKNSKEFVNSAEEQLEKTALLKLKVESAEGALESSLTETCRIYGNETSCSIPLLGITHKLSLNSGFVIAGYKKDKTATTATWGKYASVTINKNTTIYTVTNDTQIPNKATHTSEYKEGTKSTYTNYKLKGAVKVCDNSTTLTRDTSKGLYAYIGSSPFSDKYNPDNTITYDITKDGKCSIINYIVETSTKNWYTGLLTLELEEGFFYDSSGNKSQHKLISTGVSFVNLIPSVSYESGPSGTHNASDGNTYTIKVNVTTSENVDSIEKIMPNSIPGCLVGTVPDDTCTVDLYSVAGPTYSNEKYTYTLTYLVTIAPNAYYTGKLGLHFTEGFIEDKYGKSSEEHLYTSLSIVK